ncbi:MAG: hypothetical protein ACRYFX_28150 [Janthinobacterium lividum]
MKKLLLLPALCGAMQCVISCHHAAEEVQPVPVPALTINTQAANYDVLANATGHWQWERNVSVSGVRDSARVGYGRRLRFRSDSTVLLSRTGLADVSIPYGFTADNNHFCTGGPKSRFLVYATNEPLVPNNDRKTYSLQTGLGPSAPTKRVLSISGEGVCVDAGSSESYHWVAEK